MFARVKRIGLKNEGGFLYQLVNGGKIFLGFLFNGELDRTDATITPDSNQLAEDLQDNFPNTNDTDINQFIKKHKK